MNIKERMNLTNTRMKNIHQLVLSDNAEIKREKIKEPVSVGVDLGTSSIVLIVADADGEPVFAASRDADVVRDGLVVKYSEAVKIVRELKAEAEEVLGIELTHASGAIPPGTIGNNRNAVGHVIEAAEMEVLKIIDEPEAAAKAMNVTDGAVVDIGGGTTGISIFKKGKMVFSADEPTGGTQMTLVLSGALGIPLAEGEARKRDVNLRKQNFQIIRPVVEKMATITANFIKEYGKSVRKVYLVGGATNFDEFQEVFSKIVSAEILKPEFPEFVTPFGIALSDAKAG